MTEPDPFRENADLIRAFEERTLTGGMQVPNRVLFDLEEVRGKALQARKQPRHSSFVIRHSSLLRMAAVLALLAAVTWLLLPTSTPTARVIVTSPGDETNSTQPVIAWNSKDKAGQKYDVWILPATGDHLTAPVLFVTKGVTSPVTFDSLKPGKGMTDIALQPGTDYRVLVCLADAGRMAGVPVPFKVKPAP
jgi:hypothetical protein